MRTSLLAVLAALVGAATTGCVGNKLTDQEGAILALVLRQSYTDAGFTDGGYTVVDPETGISFLTCYRSEDVKRNTKDIVEQLSPTGADITNLVARFFIRNRKPVRLSIESSLAEGYRIDYDGTFEKYFKEGGGGWKKWRKEHPEASGHTVVSVPVYDEKNDLILIYMGSQGDWLAGSGYLILYKYENGRLKHLGQVMIWIS